MAGGRLGVSEFRQNHSKVRMSERISRVQSDRALQMVPRFREIAQFLHDDREVVVHFGILGIHRQGALEMVFCSAEFMLVRKQDTEEYMRGEHVRRKRQRLLIMGFGFAEPAHVLEFSSDLVMS